jgi:hypothetical protein
MVRAFFIGRALASTVSEQVERTMTDALSSLGQLDAEQRETLRQFADEVMARAEHEEAEALKNQPTSPGPGPAPSSDGSPTDLQATIDTLRAEIAQVRASLQQYRSSDS